jgi:esterase/lipase
MQFFHKPIFLLLAIGLISSMAKADYQFDLETLEQVLNDQESEFADIVVGSEKHIRWYQGKQQSDIALVYIHGFSASRQELSPTTEHLADQLKANVYYARLQGHGRSEDAMAEATVAGWKKDARQAYLIGKKIGKRVVLISTSTGGTLATWLAANEFDKAIIANILISPNFDVASNVAKIVTWPGGLSLAKWISGDYRSFTPMSEEHGRYWTYRYPIEAVLPMFDLLEEVRQLDKSKINTPHLIVYSPNDKVIDIEAIKTTSQEFASAQVETKLFVNSTDPYQHVLAGVACSPESTDEMIQLLNDYITQLR